MADTTDSRQTRTSHFTDIASCVKHNTFFTLMADEVADVSNKEQVAICLKSVGDDFQPHEEFVGMHSVDSLKSNTLVAVLRDVLTRLNLSIQDCRGQCYDGPSNMAGAKNGVATQILAEEPRAIFTHCYGRALNLAARDMIKRKKILRDFLDATLEMSKLIKWSPRPDAIFHYFCSISFYSRHLSSFLCFSICLWNNLPASAISQCRSVSSFRSFLHSFYKADKFLGL